MGWDEVVLLDREHRPSGSAAKAEVHTTDTPLHLAYSCYLVDKRGRVLLTRRALTKSTWPGVWTNAFCGHPRPGEPITDAVRRGARDELGVVLDRLDLVLADFAYRATDPHGTVENEFCPVFRATTSQTPILDPAEAIESAWIGPDALVDAVTAAPFAFSPWLVRQLEAMVAEGWPWPVRTGGRR